MKKAFLLSLFLLTGIFSTFAQQSLEVDAQGTVWIYHEGTRISLQEYLTPVGTIESFAGNQATLPSGWLICDGARINKVNNPKYTRLVDLFHAIAAGNSDHPYTCPLPQSGHKN